MALKIVARFTKEFVRGDNQGEVSHESMDFHSVAQAERWEKIMTGIETLDYVIRDFYIENPKHA
jgi:hypothetical protein